MATIKSSTFTLKPGQEAKEIAAKLAAKRGWRLAEFGPGKNGFSARFQDRPDNVIRGSGVVVGHIGGLGAAEHGRCKAVQPCQERVIRPFVAPDGSTWSWCMMGHRQPPGGAGPAMEIAP